MTFNLSAAIVETAMLRPTAPAILSPGRTMDYATLSRAILGTAAALVRQGVQPGMTVGLVMTDTPTDVVALFALFRLGAPALVLSHLETQAERSGHLERLGAAFCIGAEAHRRDRPVRYIAYETLSPDSDPAALPPLPDPTVVAYFNRSSGTTLGRPKLIGITHTQRSAREAWLAPRFPRGPEDRHLHIVTLANSFGRSAATTMLQAGGTVVFPPTLHGFPDVREFVQRQGITVAALSPPFVRDFLGHSLTEPLLAGVRVMVGTAALTTTERRAALARLTPDLYIGYSTNETGYLAAATPEDLAVDIDSVGRPLAGIDAEVVDDDLRPLPRGTMGELRFRHPGFPKSYAYAVPGSTSRFQDGWFYPGDAGVIDDAGRIALKGRIDDVINVGGRKVHPSAIESWLATHPAVVETAVVAVRASHMGHRPIAAVVLRAPVAEADLMRTCREQGGSLPLPRRIIAVEALPRNRAGKVDRTALIQLLRPHLLA